MTTGVVYMPTCHPTCRKLGASFARLAASSLVLALATGPAARASTEIDAAAIDRERDADEAATAASEPPVDATFLDSVTVSATLTERTLEETPGNVDVIDADEIAEVGYTGVADLVRFAPGVYVEGDLSRLGTSGFNIRGIGGNRVLMQVDGVPTAEQFDFGPFRVHQYSVDLDTLERAEIVRSAGSALYGSDALGGVVSLVTRGPRSYLGAESQHLGLRAGYDSRAEEGSESLVYARGNETWAGSIVWTHRDGAELGNQGDVESLDFTRAAPNPIDRRQDNALVKLARTGQRHQLEAAVERFDSRAETEVLSARNPGSPFASAVRDADAVDTQERLRLSLEQSWVHESFASDSVFWRMYWQQAETEQRTDEVREGSLGLSDRAGLLSYDQGTLGLSVEARKGLGPGAKQALTYGASFQRDSFDQLRDRVEVVIATGAPVPTSLVFPTKYFPESEVQELGAFVQAELDLWDGRLRLVPGLRYDRYDLDADERDVVFRLGNPGQPDAVDLADDAVSPKLGVVLSVTDALSVFGQLARGFRAPPMSAVNNGFTNQAGGYRTLANPDLDAETSDNLEVGFRGNFRRASFSIAYFDNRFDDFIETVFLGFDPIELLVEFQPQNIQEVEISGIELSAELRFGRSWRWRAAYSNIEGDNVTDDEPLDSIAPPRFVTGLRYARPGARWGVEGTATLVDAKRARDLPTGSDLFRTPRYEVVDVAAWLSITRQITVQLSAWNLTDETYWPWTHARGRTEGSPDLDRFTSPGRSFGLQARVTF